MTHLHKFSVFLTDEEWIHLQGMAERQRVAVDNVAGGAVVGDIRRDMRREATGGDVLEKYLGEDSRGGA